MHFLVCLALALQLGMASCASPPETGTDCNKRRSCVKYLHNVRKSVYREWSPADDVQGGTVTLSFRLNAHGRIQEIAVVRSDSDALAASCKQAMQQVDQFPPIPEGLEFLVSKKIVATFAFSRPSP